MPVSRLLGEEKEMGIGGLGVGQCVRQGSIACPPSLGPDARPAAIFGSTRDRDAGTQDGGSARQVNVVHVLTAASDSSGWDGSPAATSAKAAVHLYHNATGKGL
jgi:hypothetical protein